MKCPLRCFRAALCRWILGDFEAIIGLGDMTKALEHLFKRAAESLRADYTLDVFHFCMLHGQHLLVNSQRCFLCPSRNELDTVHISLLAQSEEPTFGLSSIVRQLVDKNSRLTDLFLDCQIPP